jgi:ferredoxin
MRVSVDTGKCIASGSCVFASPEVFDQDEEGTVVLLDAEPGDNLHESVRNAAAACPASVIHVEE